MSIADASDESSRQQSGKVKPTKFLSAALLAIGIAALMSCGLYLALENSSYEHMSLLVLVPLPFAFLVLQMVLGKKMERKKKAGGIIAGGIHQPTAVAEVQPVPYPYSGQVLTIKTAILTNLLVLVPILIQLVGIVLCGWGAYLCFSDQAQTSFLVEGAVLMVAGLLFLVPGTYFGWIRVGSLSTGYVRRLARKQLDMRPDRMVEAEDPQAIFVEVVPRVNWNRFMLDDATDVGFLVTNEARREILFEGDQERYRISGRAILSCHVEELLFGSEMMRYMVVITAIRPTGIWELPVTYRGDLSSFSAAWRKARALALLRKIQSIAS